jgi:hypothetical protein
MWEWRPMWSWWILGVLVWVFCAGDRGGAVRCSGVGGWWSFFWSSLLWHVNVKMYFRGKVYYCCTYDVC